MLVFLLVSAADIFLQPVHNVTEEMQVMWAVAEADMQALVNDGLVPSSSIKSGGVYTAAAMLLAACLFSVVVVAAHLSRD